MKRYEGKRNGSAADVIFDGQPLNPRLDLWTHSPTGFEWGYPGSGPAQLALALLADCLGGDQQAMQWHQDFKSAVIAGLPYAGWRMTEQEIRETLYAFENE
ncbi:MAG: DUF6166 domain-containing protein [Verrucomicrobiota bacterium]